MTSEGPDIAREELISIEEVGEKILASQIEVSRVVAPFFGWTFLSFVLLDVVGNIVGFPVFTGAIFGNNPQWAIVAATGMAFFLQIALFGCGIFCLFLSPWRFWISTMFSPLEFGGRTLGADKLLDEKFRSLFGVLTEKGRRIVDAGQEEGETSVGVPISVRVGLMIVALIAAVYLISWLWFAAVSLMVIGTAVALLSDKGVKCFNVLWVKISSDYGSLMGTYLGAALAGASSLLVGAQRGLYLRYPLQVWVNGYFFTFRLVEVFLLAGIILVLVSQTKAGLKCAIFYRAQKPVGGFKKTYHVFDFRRVATWPVYLHIDPNSISKAVVLLRKDDKHYEVFDHTLRIPLMSGVFTILNLSALEAQFVDSRSPVKDNREFFTCVAEYRIKPRTLDSIKGTMLGSIATALPDRTVGLFMDEIFKNERPLNFLNDTLSGAIDDYSNGRNQTARDIRDKYTEVEGDLREAGMLADAQLQVSSLMASGDASGLALSITGYNQLRAASSRMRALMEGPREEWKYYREKRAQAREKLPLVFQKRLRDRFTQELKDGGSSPGNDLLLATADCLLAFLGVDLVVKEFDFTPGPAYECQNMMQTLEASFATKQAKVDQEIQRREHMMLDFLQRRVELAEENKRLVVNQLIQAAPHVLPYLLQTRGGEKFLDYLLSLGESALRNKVEDLSRIPPDRPADIEAHVRDLSGSGMGRELGGSGA